MNIKHRAKKILSYSTYFSFSEGMDESLGEIIGIYDNSPEKDFLTIYENGIRWKSDHGEEELHFEDIEKTSLEGDKYSDYIFVFLKNKEIIKLPVRGKRGQFSDSCLFISFLKNVIADIQRKQRKGLL